MEWERRGGGSGSVDGGWSWSAGGGWSGSVDGVGV